MKITGALFIIVLAVIPSCKKNDDPTTSGSKTVFTANISGNYDGGNSTNWAVFHDSTGKCLGYRTFKNGTTLTYAADNLPGNMITVTLISKLTPTGANPFYNISTYFNVNAGDVWTLKWLNPPVPINVATGEFDVLLDYTTEPNQGLISDMNGNQTYSERVPSNGLNFECLMYPGDTDFYLTIKLSDGTLKQKLLSNGENDQRFEFKVDDLPTADNLTTFQLPPGSSAYNVIVSGKDPSQPDSAAGYRLQYELTNSAATSVTAGYPSALNRYSTFLYSKLPNSAYLYYKNGDIPSNVTWPDPTKINLGTGGLGNLTSTSSVPVYYLQTNYGLYDGTVELGEWMVWSATINQKMNAFPADLLASEPNLAFNLYTRDNSYFCVQSTDDYQTFLGTKFKGMTELTFERLLIAY